MPVTVSAKRALRAGERKQLQNKKALSALEVAIRRAISRKKGKDINYAMSLADRAAKKHTIHKNKASRIKSMLAKLS